MVGFRLALLAIASLTTMALVVGCGDDNDEDGARAAGEGRPRGVFLSRPEFIAEASKGCRAARSDLEEDVNRFLTRQRGEKPRPILYADLAHLIILPAIEAEMEAIRNLGVPDSELEPIERFLDDAEFTINSVVYQERIPSIAAVYREFEDVTAGFRNYGLPACVNGTSVIDGQRGSGKQG